MKINNVGNINIIVLTSVFMAQNVMAHQLSNDSLDSRLIIIAANDTGGWVEKS